MKIRFLLPLIIFVLIAVFLGAGLKLDPREVPSPLIGKAAPAFSLPSLYAPEKMVQPGDFKGQVWLLNVWATWCASCKIEHESLVRLSRQERVPIVGLNYKDESEKAKQWLKNLGNPYLINAFDEDGRVAIDWGVYGAPETYVIDKLGIVRLKHTGPVNSEILNSKIIPLVTSLQAQS